MDLVEAVALAAVSTLTFIACWTDLRKMEIPNVLTVPFALAGLVYHGSTQGWDGLGSSVSGLLCGMAPLLVLYLLRGIGGGDVKWFAAYGAWTGVAQALALAVWSILFAGGIAALLLLMRAPGLRKIGKAVAWPWGRHPLEAAKGAAKFPFMLAVVPAFAVLTWGQFA